MATLADIIARKYPGMTFTITADDYATLIWDAANTTAKPDEATLRSFSVEVDGLVQADRDAEAQQRAMWDHPDAMLRSIEVLADAVASLLGPGAQLNRVNTLRNRLAQIRANVKAPPPTP
jgi:hypothetical protein